MSFFWKSGVDLAQNNESCCILAGHYEILCLRIQSIQGFVPSMLGVIDRGKSELLLSLKLFKQTKLT